MASKSEQSGKLTNQMGQERERKLIHNTHVLAQITWLMTVTLSLPEAGEAEYLSINSIRSGRVT
jgi:hypothetical protein